MQVKDKIDGQRDISAGRNISFFFSPASFRSLFVVPALAKILRFFSLNSWQLYVFRLLIYLTKEEL